MIQTDDKKIAIYLTNKCNLHCKHCFIEGSPQNDQFLSFKQIKTALNYFHRQGYGAVEFTGGESCLSPFLFPAIKYAKKLGYHVGVNTNGINHHLISQLDPHQIDKLTFSIDGATSKTHDFLRGKGTFGQCLASISLANEKGFRTEAIFTVHKLNFKEIPQAISLLDKLGVSRLSFNFINNRGTATLNQKLLLPAEKWIAARKLIEENSDTEHLGLRYPVLFVTKEELKDIRNSTNYFCRILQPVKTEVYPDGKIYHCCFVTDTLSAGTVTDTKVNMDTAKEIAFVNKYRHLSCPALQVHQLYASSTNLIPVCLYYKEFTKSNSL